MHALNSFVFRGPPVVSAAGRVCWLLLRDDGTSHHTIFSNNTGAHWRGGAGARCQGQSTFRLLHPSSFSSVCLFNLLENVPQIKVKITKSPHFRRWRSLASAGIERRPRRVWWRPPSWRGHGGLSRIWRSPTTYTVGVIKNETLVLVNFSAQDAPILKISVPIIKRRSWGFQNTPYLQSLVDF